MTGATTVDEAGQPGSPGIVLLTEGLAVTPPRVMNSGLGRTRKCLRDVSRCARLQAHQPENDMQTTYWNGDMARYTGKTMTLHGGLFYEIEMLEGHLKGHTKVTQRAPAGYQNDDQADQDERRYAEA